MPVLAGRAWKSLQDARVQRWWNLVCSGVGNPDELSARINAGLRAEDANVIAGVVEGARAATQAVVLAAVPVIAALSRRFFQAGDLPRWFYRGSLARRTPLVTAASATATSGVTTESTGPHVVGVATHWSRRNKSASAISQQPIRPAGSDS